MYYKFENKLKEYNLVFFVCIFWDGHSVQLINNIYESIEIRWDNIKEFWIILDSTFYKKYIFFVFYKVI